MSNLNPETEQQLAEMNDDDWRALTARIRPPDAGANGRAEAQRRINNTKPNGAQR
jgi:hypothetical protein